MSHASGFVKVTEILQIIFFSFFEGIRENEV